MYKKKYYMFGGKFSDQRAFSPIECFDCTSMEWKSFQNTLEENKIEHSLDQLDSYLVIFGGYEAHRIYNDLKAFDLEKLSWISLQPKSESPSHRYGHASIVYKQDLYIFGGMDKQRPLNDMWRYSISGSSWMKVKYTGLVGSLFRSALVEVNGGFIIVGGAKGFQVTKSSEHLEIQQEHLLVQSREEHGFQSESG